ncbi:MAG: sigma 54-interacting transcriptional regulator [Myxococcota bacterium]
MEAFSTLLPDLAAFAVDQDRRLVMWSRAAEALLGFAAEDVLGDSCLHAQRCTSCLVGCGIAEHQHIDDVPLVLHDASGRSVHVRKSGRAFFDREGNFLGGIEVLRPVESAATPRPRDPADQVTFHGMVSRDPAMLRAFQTIQNVAETDSTVLIRGESGTGKELVARALHRESHRREGPFVAVNCAALTPSLVESELFGHKKGAFTGAAANRHGLFQRANGGTIFLDEVAELPLDVQAKLLRVLEEREVVPVGAERAVPVDARVIAATHRGLRRATELGTFREDLMYRLRVVPIFLPTLRVRRSDIEPLLWHFIEANNRRGPRRVRTIDPEAMRALLHHRWPGNVRELRNVVDYGFAVGRGATLTMDDLPPEFLEARAEPTPDDARSIGTPRHGVALDERARIETAIDAHDGHLGKAAQALGMSRPTLWRKRKKYGLSMTR